MPPSAHPVLAVRALNDELCEKRKAAALQIEKMVKPPDILYSGIMEIFYQGKYDI